MTLSLHIIQESIKIIEQNGEYFHSRLYNTTVLFVPIYVEML